MHKTSAMIRIIVWALVALFLTAVLVLGLTGSEWITSHLSLKGDINFGTVYTYPHADRYTAGGGAADAAAIREVDINWVAGNVTIIPCDGSEIKFYETGAGEDPDNQMRHWIENGTLRIQYRASQFSFGFIETDSKQLTVEIPSSMDTSLIDLDIDATSASISVSKISVSKISVNTVSGGISLDTLNSSKLTAESVSGSITSKAVTADIVSGSTVSGTCSFTGSFGELSHESVSGSVTITSDICPEEIDCSSVSGNITVCIPENNGFTAEYDTVSGDFRCDFAVTSAKSSATYNRGGAEFDFETVSGDIIIERISKLYS